jgi:hypothetical protein
MTWRTWAVIADPRLARLADLPALSAAAAVQRSKSDKLRPLTDVNPRSTCACACAQLLAYALDVQPLLWRSSPRHEMMHYLILTNCIALLSTTAQSVHGHATTTPRGCLLGHYSCHYVSSRRQSQAQSRSYGRVYAFL